MIELNLETMLLSKITDGCVFFLKGPLSQWWPSDFSHQGRGFKNCERRCWICKKMVESENKPEVDYKINERVHMISKNS